MAGLPPGQEAGPTAELPPWLSYTSSATATLEIVYTYATLLQNGVPTLATSAAVVTRYGTDLLQLPITVDASAVAGQNLGTLYTTAGGTGIETVVGIVGETGRVTLGATPSAAITRSAGDGSADPTNPATSNGPSAAATATTTASMAFSSANGTPAASGGSEASSSLSAEMSTATSTATPSTSSTDFVTTQPRSTATAASSSSQTRSTLSDASTSLKLGITPIPSLRLPPTPNNLATGLTPSQLAAAIASPICFFFAVVLLLAFFCCCVRRRRRKRAQQRALAEEESLLETPETTHSAGVDSGRDARTISGGILWDWVPRRVPSRVSDRSGQSVLSRLTGGLVGGRRSRSRSNRSRAATTPRSSPLEGEKFFGTTAEKPTHKIGYPQAIPNEQTSLLSPHSAESVHHAVPSPRGHWSALPQATSPPMTFLGGPVGAISALQRPADESTVTNVGDQRLAEPFDDIDLTSPRLDLGDFEPLPLANNEDRTSQHSPPPTLPPIPPSGGFRLTRLYNADGTYAGAYLPPSPSSYTAPPISPPRSGRRSSLAPPITATGHSPGRLGLVRRATTTLSEIWNGYETASPNTDDGLGTFGAPSGEPSSLLGASPKKRNSATWSRYGEQPSTALRTPPQTPPTPRAYGIRSSRAKESPAPRTPSPRRQQERILSEGGWLSGRIAAYMAGEGREESAAEDEGGDIGGLRQRPVSTDSSSGGTADLTRTPESNLFMNDPRWRGRPPHPPLSPPPFTSFHLVEDAPVALAGSDPSLSTKLAHEALTPSVSGSSASDTSAQRYKDAFDPQASPRRPPFHSSSRVEVVGRNPNRMSYESGVSVLGRIAASFGALRSKRSDSPASEWDSPRRGPPMVGAGGPARSRTREISVESAADPFHQQKFQPTLSPPPPSVVSPVASHFDTPKANANLLRHSASQPTLMSPTRTSPGRMLFRPSRPGSAYEGHRSAPYRRPSRRAVKLAFLRKFGGGSVNPPTPSGTATPAQPGGTAQAAGQQEAQEWFTENPLDRYYGLENFGNTCYANSVIQSLYFSAPFRHLVESYVPYGEDPPVPASPIGSAASNSLYASPPSANNVQLSTSPSSSTAFSALSSASKVAKSVGTAMTTPYAPVSPPTLSIRVPPGQRPAPASGGSRGALFSPNRRQSVSSATPASPTGFSGGAPLGQRTTQNSFTGVGAPVVGQNGVIVKPVTGGETTLLSTLRDLFCAISSQPRGLGTIAPQAFINQLKTDNEFFRSTLHQDAHEFFNVLINSIAETLEVEERKRAEDEGRPPSMVGTGFAAHARTWVHQLFEGILTNETRCLSCETVTSRDEAFLDLSIDIEQNTSITACLRQFSASEMLCQRNKFSCDRCCGLQEAEKRMKVKKLPNILALHLKRFKYEESLQRHVKLTCRVVFPFELRLFNTADDIANPDRLYELWAIVVHIGVGPHHGHYITVVKSGKRWIVFDDNNVFPIEQSEIARFFGDTPGQGSGYVLFYQAVDLDWTGIDIPPPPTPSVAGTAQSRARAHTNSSVSTGGLATSADGELPPVPPLPSASISGGLMSPAGPTTPLTPGSMPIPLVDPTASLPDTGGLPPVFGSVSSSDDQNGDRRESAGGGGGWSGLRGKFSRTKSSTSSNADRRASFSAAPAPVFGGSEPLAAIQSRDDALNGDVGMGTPTGQSGDNASLPAESPNLQSTRGRLPSFNGGSSAARAPSEDGSASTTSAAPTTSSSPFINQRRRDSRPSFGAADVPASSNGTVPPIPAVSAGVPIASGATSAAPPTNAFASRTRSFLSRSRTDKARPTSSHSALPPTNGFGLGLSMPSTTASGGSDVAPTGEAKQPVAATPSGLTQPSNDASTTLPPPVPTPAWIPSPNNSNSEHGLDASTSSLSKKDLEKRQKEEQKLREREAKERAKAEKDRSKLLAKEESGGATGKLWRKMSLR